MTRSQLLKIVPKVYNNQDRGHRLLKSYRKPWCPPQPWVLDINKPFQLYVDEGPESQILIQFLGLWKRLMVLSIQEV